MKYIFRRLLPCELDEALKLAWSTYMEFEAPDYALEGIETFKRDIMENEEFKIACCNGNNRMWGAFDENKIVGIFVMRGVSHICMVFTHRDYHRNGIGTNIFKQLLKDVKIHNPQVKELTLNSSPYGKPFYYHIGFMKVATEKTIDGIRFTPMVFKL